VSKGIESQVDAVADFTLRLDFDSGAALTAHDVLSDDERLMGRLRAGEPDAYEQLIELYQQPVITSSAA
jgi:hypothetical protein